MNLNVGIGDIVTVIPEKQGKFYTTYEDWFRFYGISRQHWSSCEVPLIEKEYFVVKVIAPHHEDCDTALALIENCRTGFQYLGETTALKPCTENLQTKDNVYFDIINYLTERINKLEQQHKNSCDEKETIEKYKATFNDLKAVCKNFREIMGEII